MKGMNTFARGLCGVSCVLVLAVALGAGVSVAGEKAPIKIGLPLDQSAVMADIGIVYRETYRMFVKEVNEKGGFEGHPLELIITDSQADPTRVTTLSERYITRDNVLLLMGGTNSTENSAMKAVGARHKTAVLATSGSVTALSNPADPWTFQINGRDDERFVDILKIIVEELKAKKVAMIYLNSAYGEGAKRDMTTLLRDKYKLEPAAMEATEAGMTTLVPQMLRIKNSGAEAVIPWIFVGDVPVALRAMQEIGLNIPAVTNLACTASNIKLTGKIPIHHISHAVWSWDKPEAMAVAERLEKFMGKPTKYEDVWGVPWNGMQVFMEGLRTAKLSFDPAKLAEDRQKLRDAIEAIKDLPIVGGTNDCRVSFGPNDHLAYRQKCFVNKETFNGVDWEMYKRK